MPKHAFQQSGSSTLHDHIIWVTVGQLNADIAQGQLLCSCQRPNVAVGDFDHQTTSSWWHCRCLSWPSGPSPLGTEERCTGQQLAGQLCLLNPGQHSTNEYRYICHVFTELQTSPKHTSINLYVMSSLSFRSVLDTPASTHMSFFTELKSTQDTPASTYLQHNDLKYFLLYFCKCCYVCSLSLVYLCQ